MRRVHADPSRLILVASIVLTLLLLPSVPGCGCGEDSGDPTSLRGGCRVCVAFRVLPEDFGVMYIPGENESAGPQTLDLTLCLINADPGVGDVSVAPPCVEGLEVGDVAEWEVISDQEQPIGSACFGVCRCEGQFNFLDVFCVEWFGECGLYRIDNNPPFQESTTTPSIPGRVVECDDLPGLCCFCIQFQCTDGFRQPELSLPGTALVGGGSTSGEEEEGKLVCATVPQFDPSLADGTLGGMPLVKPPCQVVSIFGGIAQFEICVLDTYQPGSTMTVQFAEPGDQISRFLASATILFGTGGLCEVILQDTEISEGIITLNPTCEPPQQLCCVPVSICAAPVTPALAAFADITAKVAPGTTVPGVQIFPPTSMPVQVPDTGGPVVFWVCVPDDNPNGNVIVNFCSSVDFLGAGGSAPYPLGSATFVYTGSCQPAFTAPPVGPNQVPVVFGIANPCLGGN